MKKNVALRITSSQYSENLRPSGEAFVRDLELEDSIEILTEGVIYSGNDSMYIVYNDSEQPGDSESKTMLKLTRPDSLSIRRYGADDEGMDMELKQGIRNITRYRIPELAALDMEVYTNSVNDTLDEEGYGTISVDYKIKFDAYYSRRNLLEIEVKPA